MTTTAAFIAKWAASGAAERANAQLFVADLCALLGVDAPQPKTPDEHANAYVFEKTIPGAAGTSNFIDCYKRGCFVLEAKQAPTPIPPTHPSPLPANNGSPAEKPATAAAAPPPGIRPWNAPANKPKTTPAACPPKKSPAWADRLSCW